ncbi:MAG TPA: ABC transporter transmembrane domain-containing protein, partial [Gaiellaceae bacterium]
MSPLDRRLLGRARAARRLLGLDVVLGLATAGLVLVQATLLADVVARAFAGAGLKELRGTLVLLAAAFAARGVLAWGFEVAGRRAASSVLSELRRALVERRLRDQPASLDGVEGGEVAAAAVQGVDGLEAYFARYLPQVVLAAVVPFAVLAWVAWVDLGSALLLLVTLPLVPVFMWLIGRYTAERTRERWLALRLLSTHFLDVVRGLPTLRAFNRSRAQAETLEPVGESYRRV